MKHGVLQLFILLFIAGCFNLQASPLEFTPSVQDTTTRYGYWTDIPSKKEKKQWNVFGIKIPIYTPPKRMERGIVKSLFIPAKTWQTGISFSHYEENNDDYDFLIIENWKGKAYSLRISPFFCWYFKNNQGVGGRFTYKNTHFNIRELSISIEDDMSFTLDNAYIILDEAQNTTPAQMKMFLTRIMWVCTPASAFSTKPISLTDTGMANCRLATRKSPTALPKQHTKYSWVFVRGYADL